jgi:N-acetylmuramoyl-L-alanine amidase
MLEGVYEENLRTQQGEPAPRRQDDEDAAPARSRLMRWGAALVLAGFVLASGAAYVSGGPSFLRRHLFPPAQATAQIAGRSPAPPVADSLRGRGAPFASDSAAHAPSQAPSHALPHTGTETAPSVAGLFGLEVKTVVLDPGHGGKKDGAVGPDGTKEKHVALDVSRRLRRRLRVRYGYRILMTRTGDTHQSLRDRARFANGRRADLFVSIHVNSLPDEDVTSIETYYYGSQASAEVRRLAERENRASGYSVAEFNRLLNEMGRRMRRQESERLAASIQKSLYRNIKGRNPDVRDWGVRTAPFVVLLGVEAPSVLAEIGVISNPAEEAKLRRPAYREDLARFLEEGVARYLGDAPPPASGDTTDTAGAPPPATRS